MKMAIVFLIFADRAKGISKIPRLEIFRTLKNLIVYIFKKKFII